MINPKEIIAQFSVSELAQTADAYFATITDPTPQMSKPFSAMHEAPELLQNMGLLLSGLHLGKTMTVLEFAAGTCWFSRYLNQLQCHTISCDVSAAALAIGRRLFQEYPIVGEPIAEPQFLIFDGYKIDLPDESVDRIVCHDGFHHVPNQEDVLAEMGRVLKQGGIAGFSEPGRFHSRNPQSQYEMKNYNVLENDIIMADIATLAQKHGFTNVQLKVFGDIDISLPRYQMLTSKVGLKLLEFISPALSNHLKNRTIFFLYKGDYQPDSRTYIGLAHTISLQQTEFTSQKGEPLRIPLQITNAGQATWLTNNISNIGVVNIGTHLYDENNRLLDLDFSRHPLPAPIPPQTTFAQTIAVQFPNAGVYKIAVDLVSERICWFENMGSKPQLITVSVE